MGSEVQALDIISTFLLDGMTVAGELVRGRQDAASLRAALGRGDEGRGLVPRAAHGNKIGGPKRGTILLATVKGILARIGAERGFADDKAPDAVALSRQSYRGGRHSFGYPACPNLADQRPLLDLLGAERVGLKMSDEDQLEPGQSTSAIVVVHPPAKYFSV